MTMLNTKSLSKRKNISRIHKKIKERHKIYYNEIKERQVAKLKDKQNVNNIVTVGVKSLVKRGYLDEILYHNENPNQLKEILIDYECALESLKKLYLDGIPFSKAEMKKCAEILLFKIIKFKPSKEFLPMTLLKNTLNSFKNYSEDVPDKQEDLKWRADLYYKFGLLLHDEFVKIKSQITDEITNYQMAPSLYLLNAYSYLIQRRKEFVEYACIVKDNKILLKEQHITDAAEVNCKYLGRVSMDNNIESKLIIKKIYDSLMDSTVIMDCITKSYDYENFFNSRRKCHYILYLKAMESKFHTQYNEYTEFLKLFLNPIKKNKWPVLYSLINQDDSIQWKNKDNENMIMDKIVYSSKDSNEVKKYMDIMFQFLTENQDRTICYELEKNNKLLTLTASFTPDQTTMHDYSTVKITLRPTIDFPIAFSSIRLNYEDNNKDILKFEINSTEFNGDVLLKANTLWEFTHRIDIDDKPRTKMLLKYMWLKFKIGYTTSSETTKHSNSK